MSIKIVKLITGEEIVCRLDDLLDSEQNKVGFKMTFPYKVIIRPYTGDNDEQKFDVNYISWMAASADPEFTISYNSVVAIGDPIDEVGRLYMERYNEFLETLKTTSVAN
jgi:hypothetical protein